MGHFCFLPPVWQANPLCTVAECLSRAAAGTVRGHLPAAALRTVLFSGAVRSLYAHFAQNIRARACGLAGSMVN